MTTSSGWKPLPATTRFPSSGPKEVSAKRIMSCHGCAGCARRAPTESISFSRAWNKGPPSLGLDIAASFGWGLFSSDASYAYFKSTMYSRYNHFLDVYVSVQNAPEFLHHSYLTPSAISFANAGPSTFIRMCGDQYVYGRQTGGELHVVVQVSSSSQS